VSLIFTLQLYSFLVQHAQLNFYPMEFEDNSIGVAEQHPPLSGDPTRVICRPFLFMVVISVICGLAFSR